MTLHSRSLLLAPLLLLAACADNMASVQLRHVCSPPEQASTCSFSATCDAVSLAPFSFDVSVGSPRMWMFIEVGNKLDDNSSAGDGRTNTNDAYVQEALISYEGGGLDLSDASHRLLQMIPAGTTQVLSLYPLPDSATAELATFTITGLVDIVAKMRLKGVYAHGDPFETAEYEIPIRICSGCIGTVGCPNPGELLFTCPPGAVDTAGNVAQLPLSTECVAP